MRGGRAARGRRQTVHGQLTERRKRVARAVRWAGQRLDIPLSDVRGCWLGGEQPEQRDRNSTMRLKPAANRLGPDHGPRSEPPRPWKASLKGVTDGKLEFVVAGETRKVALDRVLGFVLAAHPPRPAIPTRSTRSFRIDYGGQFSGQLTSVDAAIDRSRTPWNGGLKLPRARCERSPAATAEPPISSDLEPVAVEETAYLLPSRPIGATNAWRADRSCSPGTDLRKGLAVHSRSLLTYPLDGRYESFQCRLGFDDVRCLAARSPAECWPTSRNCSPIPTCGPDADPPSLTLDVAGAKQLMLEVDFGPGQDVGDRVTWAGGASLSSARHRPPRPLRPSAIEPAKKRETDERSQCTQRKSTSASNPSPSGRGRVRVREKNRTMSFGRSPVRFMLLLAAVVSLSSGSAAAADLPTADVPATVSPAAVSPTARPPG